MIAFNLPESDIGLWFSLGLVSEFGVFSIHQREIEMHVAGKAVVVSVLLGGLLVLVGCASVPAGPTLGDMLDKGAKKATNAQIRKAQIETPIKVVTPAGAKADMYYKNDGTFDGTVTVGTATSRNKGKWTLDDNGRFCVDENLIDWNKQVSKCYFYYTLGDQLLVIQSMTEDRSAPTTSYPMPK